MRTKHAELFSKPECERDTTSEGDSVAQSQCDWRSKVLGIEGGSSDPARVSTGGDEARFELHANDEMSRGLGYSAETPRFFLFFSCSKRGQGVWGPLARAVVTLVARYLTMFMFMFT